LNELRTLFKNDAHATSALATYSMLAIKQVPYAQPFQAPGAAASVTPKRLGLIYAGDWTTSGSINGAMRSGEIAAQTVLAAL
jgi:predicted NAD/FAD-dependent oxidoreductase